jgi:hypothetical protein
MKNLNLVFISCASIFMSCTESSELKSDVRTLNTEAAGVMADEATYFANPETVTSGSSNGDAATANDLKFSDSSSPENIPDKIIRTAEIKMQVESIKEARDKIQQNVKSLKGYFSHEEENNNYNQFEVTLTIRIPNSDFDKIMNSSLNQGKFIESKNISSEDVTSEYIDINTRLKTKKMVHERYLELLKKATKVSDIIDVEDKIRVLQEEIESTEARLKYMNDRVDYSTITLTIYELKPTEHIPDVSYRSRILIAMKDGYRGVENFFLWLFRQWAWVIIIIGVLIFIRIKTGKNKI